jgi:hypothetical protein
MVMAASPTPIHAQTLQISPQAQPGINGLVAPTAPQQFFEEGRQKLEREIQILRQREQREASSQQPLLQISDELLKQEPILQLENPYSDTFIMRSNLDKGDR